MGKKTEELERMIATLQKLELHNQVLLMTVLSILGVEDDDIDKLTKDITKTVEKAWEEHYGI